MLFIIYMWVFMAFLLMFIRPRWGVAIYLPFYILVPFLNEMGYFNYPILFALLFHGIKSGKIVDRNIIIPFVFFFLSFLFFIPFQTGIDYSRQLYFWWFDVVGIFSFPIFIYYTTQIDPRSVYVIRKSLMLCIFIAAVYGLLLTSLNGINPYVLYIHSLTGKGDMSYILNYSISDGSGRLFGRIFSCFKHPMLYAYFLGLSFIYLCYTRNLSKKIVTIVAFILLILNIVFCGVRSVIGALIIAIVFYLFIGKRIKMSLFLIILYIVFLMLIEYVPYLSDYFGSFTSDAQDSEIKGSSISMRFEQFEGCLKEIQNSPIVGKGYGWSVNYLAVKGVHPTMLAFESLILSVLCNSGFVGVIIWAVFVYLFISKYRHHFKDSLVYITTLVFYISFAMITGDYSYMKFFVLFLMIMIGEGRIRNKCNSIVSKPVIKMI